MNSTITALVRQIPRVDLTLDCIMDGTMGSVQADDPDAPKSICIHSTGFWYFGGDPKTPWAQDLLRTIPPYDLIMPSAPGWLEEIGQMYGDRLMPFTRYSFSAVSLNEATIQGIFLNSPHRENIVPIDLSIIDILQSLPETGFEIGQFESIENFLKQGFGFVYLKEQQIQGMTFTWWVSRKGIEVSIWVAVRQRQRGVATALASRLLFECFHRGLEPHWDAANGESVKLAKKLGYTFKGTYDANYIEK
jgi:RimJ/RimL family protein N-acetyltransferase